MSNIDKRALREELSNPAIGSNAHLRKLALALLDELEDAEKRNEHALSLLISANTENVWEIIGRLNVVISGDYRSEDEIAAGKGEA
ncbi:hypothetical protein [Enterobacter hormaechei]|uniref:hypothetical protein n=1 Tax=Enterobacter hormaechei TaxID=158836 RepID=UPI00084BE517|nr:hypothetical protein [Enterobacter hormaechei]AOP78597.1 hypothetical protein BFV68_13495 [Enterobacter hormaechei subsp. steigerwaltii]QXA79110.1 hypothetical protein I6L64_02070 [Enterobacter hormaechei]